MPREKLKALEELQKVDLRIRDLNAQAEQHPARLRQIESDRNQAKAVVDGMRGKVADNERARRQNEQMLQTERDKVKKWESRLSELKTPREYAALARELEIAKKTNATAEDELKRLLSEYGDLKAQIAGAEKIFGEKEQVIGEEGKRIQEILGGLQGQLKEQETARTQALKGVDRSLLAKYERIRTQRAGVAVVPVVNGTCKGCQRSVPPQMANVLRAGNELLQCPACNRFIYAVDTVPEAES